MRRQLHIVLFACITVLTLSICGCGVNATQRGTPTVGATPAATPVPTGATIVPGSVTVTLANIHYGPNDTLVVFINNGLLSSIFVADHQTNCSLVTMAYLANGTWQTVGRCRIMTPTRLVEIPASSTNTQHLVPGGGQFSVVPWPTGTYRVSVGYSTRSSTGFTPAGPVYSPQFTIG